MSVYIHRQGQQFGPFEEHQVIEQLSKGEFSTSDLGIRRGDSEWQAAWETLWQHGAAVCNANTCDDGSKEEKHEVVDLCVWRPLRDRSNNRGCYRREYLRSNESCTVRTRSARFNREI